MASDKDRMLSSANSYADIVSSAKNLCSDAALSLMKVVPNVEENWQGNSGAAMCQALINLRLEINAVYAQLEQLEEDMRSHANTIYHNWPEEIDSTGTMD